MTVRDLYEICRRQDWINIYRCEWYIYGVYQSYATWQNYCPDQHGYRIYKKEARDLVVAELTTAKDRKATVPAPYFIADVFDEVFEEGKPICKAQSE